MNIQQTTNNETFGVLVFRLADSLQLVLSSLPGGLYSVRGSAVEKDSPASLDENTILSD